MAQAENGGGVAEGGGRGEGGQREGWRDGVAAHRTWWGVRRGDHFCSSRSRVPTLHFLLRALQQLHTC